MTLFEDMGALFVDTFGDGRSFTIETSAGPKTVNGIYRSADTITLPDGDFEGIVTDVPTLRVAREDAAGIADGDTVTIDSTVYAVRAPMDDGRAMVTFRLDET
ncbi:MAG: hypothetical protein JJ902_23350 [Roseibium sp.]|nr:hypothetical protein [Roseibium sp.]